MGRKEPLMSSRYAEAEQAVLDMLRSYEMLTMEDLMIGQPQYSWAQLFLAIDVLSREGTIALHRQGLSYEIRSMNQVWNVDQGQHGESAAHHR
jgi:hypothetical protein